MARVESRNRSWTAIFAYALALRLALFYLPLSSTLAGRVEISTPITSFKRRKCGPEEWRLQGAMTTPCHRLGGTQINSFLPCGSIRGGFPL
jgi:hypothetical protein